MEKPHKTQVWSWRDAILKAKLNSTQKLVALTVSIYMNECGKGAFPSYTTISEDASLSRRTVIGAVKALCTANFLEKSANFRKNGSASSNRYTCIYPEWCKLTQIGGAAETPPKNGNTEENPKAGNSTREPHVAEGSATDALGVVQELHQGSATVAPPVVQHMHQGGVPATPHINTPFNTPFNTPTNTPNYIDVGLDDPENMFELFWTTYGKIGNKKPAKDKFTKALKGATFAEIMAGLKRYQDYCYHKGTEQKYIMHASSWLHKQAWEDEYPIYQPPKNNNIHTGDLF